MADEITIDELWEQFGAGPLEGRRIGAKEIGPFHGCEKCELFLNEEKSQQVRWMDAESEPPKE